MAAAPCVNRALLLMWRDQFDYFWDGRRRLIIGCFDGTERAPAPGARPELTVMSARDLAFTNAPTLVDVIDAPRWRARLVALDLPIDHRFVKLVAADGAELRLALAGEREQPVGGDWRLLMTLLPEASSVDPFVFRLVSLSARGDFERLAREQTASAGSRLVWAVGQRRAITRDDAGMLIARLAPARRVFPAFQSRLVIEPCAIETDAGADGREAPFAIMDHWLREQGAPRVAIRLRIPDSLEESATLLGRASVAIALQQRRRLKTWTQEQKQAGEPAIDPLSFDDIRLATGEPAEHPDAAQSTDSIVVANLLSLIVDPEEAEADGIALRRSQEKATPGMGETVEIEFYAAALGDDVGVVCPSAVTGDLGVAPSDPGGAPYARLLRVDADGLAPRRVGDDDPVLDELMRRAADSARGATSAATRAIAERAAGLQGRRDKLVTALNGALTRAEFPARLDAAGIWDPFEPLLLASFTALVAEAPAAARSRLQQFGGYNAYRVDPALTATLARGGEFARASQAHPDVVGARMAPSILTRFVTACGAEGVVSPDLDAAGQAQALRALIQDQDAIALYVARVALASDAPTRREAAAAARILADESAVDRALAHFDAHREADAASALRVYLTDRRLGRWTAPEAAIVYAAFVERAGVERDEAQAAAEIQAAHPPPEKPKGFFKRLFGG